MDLTTLDNHELAREERATFVVLSRMTNPSAELLKDWRALLDEMDARGIVPPTEGF